MKNPRATFSGDEEVSAGASVTTGRDSGASSPGEMGQRSLPTTNNAVLGDEVPASIQGHFRATWGSLHVISGGFAGGRKGGPRP